MGLDTCREIAAAGARIFCADKDPESAKQASEETGGIAWVGDVTNDAEVDRLLNNAVDVRAGLGRVDGIVDVVGGALRKPLNRITAEEWQWQLAINVCHVFYILRRAKRYVAEGGSLVFISSVSAARGADGHAAYGAAKSALNSLVQSAAVELSSSGIRVNAVAPGAFTSPRLLDAIPPAILEAVKGVIPLGRWGEPAEVARSVLYLLSDQSSYTTGQILSLDGGVGAKFSYPL